MPNKTTPIQQQITDLRTTFEDMRALLAKGAQIDLTGMDERVRILCENFKAADASTQQSSKPDFESLHGLLNILETEMRHAFAAQTANLPPSR